MKKQTLSKFLKTKKGSNLWDGLEVRIVLNTTTIFILHYNEEIEYDKLGLIKGVEFTTLVNELIVVDVKTVDEINYIFVTRKK